MSTEDRTPTGVVRESLDLTQRIIDLIWDGEKPDRVIDDPKRHNDLTIALVHTFSTGYLMAVLQRVDPATAERAAADLWGMWDDGGAIHEATYELTHPEEFPNAWAFYLDRITNPNDATLPGGAA